MHTDLGRVDESVRTREAKYIYACGCVLYWLLLGSQARTYERGSDPRAVCDWCEPHMLSSCTYIYIYSATSGESMNPLALAKPTMRTYSQPRRKAHTERAPINRSNRSIDRQIDRQSDR